MRLLNFWGEMKPSSTIPSFWESLCMTDYLDSELALPTRPAATKGKWNNCDIIAGANIYDESHICQMKPMASNAQRPSNTGINPMVKQKVSVWPDYKTCNTHRHIYHPAHMCIQIQQTHQVGKTGNTSGLTESGSKLRLKPGVTTPRWWNNQCS